MQQSFMPDFQLQVEASVVRGVKTQANKLAVLMTCKPYLLLLILHGSISIRVPRSTEVVNIASFYKPYFYS